MLLERFEDKGLSQYSYAIGCEGCGEIAIVDPRRDVDVYLDFAHARSLHIVAVLETHIHADFASGARALAMQTGATLWLSSYDDGELYEVAFPHTPMRDGEAITLGKTRIVALHTPGHTPEHLSFLGYDLARAARVPQVMLSGDFLFVGSLGRPDLIGDSKKEQLANELYDSVREKLGPLPDGLEVHPGHGAGSMCGSGMSARPMTTLGFERLANRFLAPSLSREAFVADILAHVPPFPPYYKRMKVLNAQGADPIDVRHGQAPIAAREFHTLVEGGHVVIDLRDQLAFGAAHVPGAFGIGASGSLSTWAGWAVPPDAPILLVAAHPEQVPDAVRALVRVGLDDIRGYLDGGMEKWIGAGLPVTHTRELSPAELAQVRDSEQMVVIDVRTREEFEIGHVPGAQNIFAGHLADRLGDLPRDSRPIVVICGTGYRSTVSSSILERAGFPAVVNVTGGTAAWKQAGLPTE